MEDIGQRMRVNQTRIGRRTRVGDRGCGSEGEGRTRVDRRTRVGRGSDEDQTKGDVYVGGVSTFKTPVKVSSSNIA